MLRRPYQSRSVNYNSSAHRFTTSGHKLKGDSILPPDNCDSKNGFAEGKNSNSKLKRPSIIERPKSMMVSKPADYQAGNFPTSFSVPSSTGRSRPISNLGYPSNGSDVDSNQSSVTRNEESDGLAARFLLPGGSKSQISASCESLEETPLDTTDLEKDPDLIVRPDDHDSWSATIDKKTLKKLALHKKEVKRQENIFEFILTERNHLTTLKIMQKIYARGLTNELAMDQTIMEKLFPLIDEHVDFVTQFVHKLTARQSKTTNKVVSGIGDVVVQQWEGSNGETMKRLFGDFCSKQNDITVTYRELMKNDKKFQAFMRKCDKNPMTRRQDLPACALLITQRLTKYPIMLHTMFENSNKKDHKDDYQQLERALELSREIAKDVDEQVQMHEREMLLMETYEKIDNRSSTTLKDASRKFDRKDFMKRGRKLLYSCNLQWCKDTTKKLIDVFFLLLTDCFVMLQDNNGKYIFPSGQPAAVPLQKMIVREVANDERALYLMSMSTQQMYTLKLTSADHCKTLTNKIRLAIGKCPDEDEGITSEEEYERRSQDQRVEKARQLVKQLELTDQRINRMLEEKMSFFKALAENAGRSGAVANIHFSFPDLTVLPRDPEIKFPAGAPILAKAVDQVNKLTHAFYGPMGLSRHPSSAGEHESSNRSSPSLPKRSDTFGGFDNGKEPSSPRVKYLNSSQSDSKLSDVERVGKGLQPANRDSGFHSELTVNQTGESQSNIHRAWESPVHEASDEPDGGSCSQNYLPPTSDQVTALTSLARILAEYQSFATQQDTLVEKLQQQLAGKKKPAGGGLQEAELKRNQIKQQEQMDDLRKQQQQFRAERDQWQRRMDRFQRTFDSEKSEFEKERKAILQEKEENEKQREEILKAKEEYQREVTRLRQLQRNAQHDIQTSSSASSLQPTNKNNNNSNLLEPSIRSSSISKSQSNLQNPSNEFHEGRNPPSPTLYSSAQDYPRTFPLNKRETPSHPQERPIHMQYSVVNQQAGAQRMKQDMSKVSKLAGGSKSSGGAKSSDKSGIHQLLPGKLSKLANQTHGPSTLEVLKHGMAFGHNRRKHANTEPNLSAGRSSPTKDEEKRKKFSSDPNRFDGFQPKDPGGSDEFFL